MKQVTYEEVRKSLDIVYGEDDEYYNTEDEEDRATMFDRAVDAIDNFIQQHKPPTWDEIVNSWSDIGFRSYDTSDEVACLFIDYVGNEVAFEYMKNGRFNVTTGRGYALYPEMLYAINLTIKYLEAQKHHDL